MGWLQAPFQCLFLALVSKNLINMIVNEVAPTELKGPLGALTQILVTVGIMISFFLGIPIPDIVHLEAFDRYIPDPPKATFESDNYWRLMFALPIGFSLIQGVLFLTAFNYETPKFLK
jgi:hypothetical protein